MSDDIIDTGSVGDLPREDPVLSKAAKESGIYSQEPTICRYYTAGNCRRGSSCRFMHPPSLVSVQQGMAAPANFFVH